MGDMKTPDFDDLLAAFDIPDMDASEAIHSGPEDGEGAVKAGPGEAASSDHALPHSDITAVSVIVKNTVCPDQADEGKERLLHNGFSSPEGSRPSGGPANGGESWGPRAKAKPADLFTDFAPADNPLDLIDRPKERPLFDAPADPLLCPPPSDPPTEQSRPLTFGLNKMAAEDAHNPSRVVPTNLGLTKMAADANNLSRVVPTNLSLTKMAAVDAHNLNRVVPMNLGLTKMAAEDGQNLSRVVPMNLGLPKMAAEDGQNLSRVIPMNLGLPKMAAEDGQNLSRVVPMNLGLPKMAAEDGQNLSRVVPMNLGLPKMAAEDGQNLSRVVPMNLGLPKMAAEDGQNLSRVVPMNLGLPKMAAEDTQPLSRVVPMSIGLPRMAAEDAHNLSRVVPAKFGLPKMAAEEGAISAHMVKEEPLEEHPAAPSTRYPPGDAHKPASPQDGTPKTNPEARTSLAPGGVKEEPCWSPKSLPSDIDEEEEEGAISSPSFNAASRPLKVRIKTIKTQSGSITRTVTAVSSDSAPEELPASEPKAEEKAQSPPPRSPCKAEAAKLPLGNGVKFPGPILPVSTIHNASSVMLMAASVAQQKAVVLPPPKSAKVVTKNIFHLVQPTGLANVNLTASPQRNATVVMVQSQKASPAAVATPPAGTVISRTQSSLVESFNKILNSKNLLPTYRPNLTPPAEASLALPTFGFRCLECGDSFALEKSLARHYDRRSMRIEVTCNHCTKRLVFFNKCSLLLHARKHKDNGLVMQCSHLVMRPIALEQMIGQPDVTPLVSVAVLNPPKASAPAQEAPPTAASPAAADPALLPEHSTYSTFRCLECKEQCKNKAGLAQHFQQGAPNANIGSMVCALCPMMMPNGCSFEAHQRMHKQTPPNVCPECGGNFRIENFQTHLKETCLHFSRRIGYRCQSCALVFGGVNSIKSHIQTAHCEVFHKCPICPMAFKSAPSAHAHIYTQHPGFSNQQAKMIYKCAMCDTVFTHKPLLCSHLDHAHFDQQLGNQRVSVFKCPECPLLFAQKRTMLEHLKTTHNGVLKEDPPPTPPEVVTPKPEPMEIPVSQPAEADAVGTPEAEVEESSSPESAASSPDVKKKSKSKEARKGDAPPRQRSNCWTCGICHSWFPERDEYVVHMKREHGKSVKKFPCRLCDRSFCSAPSLRRHVRVNHEGIKRVYPCRYCTEGKRTFSSRLILEKHIQVRHGIKITDPTRSQEVMVTRNVRSQAAMRKRKVSSDDSGSEDPEKHTAAAALPAVKSKRSFQCRVCGYKTGALSDFRQHIPQHCTGESSQQCRECGMCFTSHGSLSRHRVMTHKMKGAPPPDHNAQQAPPTTDDSAHSKLTCQVCNKTFDSQLNLNTHFRTHGMAFIKQRQGGAPDN